MNRIEELKTLITKYDNAYRKGEAIVPDSVYDAFVEELIELIGEDDSFFTSSIKDELEDDSDVSSERREEVPIPMYSMNKAKKIQKILDWMRLKNIPTCSRLVISPKYDGISMAKEEKLKKSWTRGSNKLGGLRSDEHLKYMNDVTFTDCDYTFGECILTRDNFQKIKDSFEGDSARNAVSGLFRRDYVSEELQHVDFIRYGVVGKKFVWKHEMFDYLNQTQKVKVPYKLNSVVDLTTEYLGSVYDEFSKDYEIDGLIIEVDDVISWEELGRERNGNPKYAIAYKGDFEEVGETTVIDIENNISKDGNIIPVAILNTIKLDNANVSRVTLNNYSFLREMGIGIGSTVKVKRSGMVIPLIVEVVDKKEFVLPPYECYWNGVHLKTTHETDEQKKKKLLAFFKILGVENVSEKTFDLLFDSGYTTLNDILSMSKNDFSKLERFGERKAEKTYDEIHDKMKNVSLSKLQHATGLFKQLGSKKLVLLESFETKPTINEVMKLEGFKETLAQNYINAYDEFFEFVKDLPITWERTKKVEATSNELEGKSFVFTGYRDKNAELEIVKRGGNIGSGVSKKTTYLVMAEKGTGSSKEQKAIDLGVTILDKNDLSDLLK